MDVFLGDDSLTFRVIGGVVDLFLFAGSSPAAVVSQLTSVVGRPSMVPYWSLGFRKSARRLSSLPHCAQTTVVTGTPTSRRSRE